MKTTTAETALREIRDTIQVAQQEQGFKLNALAQREERLAVREAKIASAVKLLAKADNLADIGA